MAPHKPRYIYGIHDPGGEQIMADEGRKGWVLFTHSLGHDPAGIRGFDYSPQASQGFGVIARLNHGYEPEGTIPTADRYAAFASCCASWARGSRGCNIWIIGNEMNFAVERPGVRYNRSTDPPTLIDPGEIISPSMYANCYRLCRDAIRSVSGHEQDEVLIGAVAPWNAQTTYSANPSGDWVLYFRHILEAVGATKCDGISLHTYTHGSDPRRVYTPTYMQPPFHNHNYDFLAYRDFMSAIPKSMRHLPVYITETDQNEAWRNENTGWVQRAYGEIDWWNRQPGNQQILTLLLYRWPKGYDRWGIEDKAGVIEDFRAAMQYAYTWRPGGVPVVYGIEWLNHDAPKLASPQTHMAIRFTMRNAGNTTWMASGEDALKAACVWNRDGEPVKFVDQSEARAVLPHDVEPGTLVEIVLQISAPEDVGEYTLRCDLVDSEGVWLADKGSNPLVLQVLVDIPQSPEEEYFEASGHWVRGAFLEFYRRYGHDITGDPISDEYVDSSTGLLVQMFQRVALEEHQSEARVQMVTERLQSAVLRIGVLELQIDELRRRLISSGLMPPPDMTDVTQMLPRDHGGYYLRTSSHIRHIVINHTGVGTEVDLEQIANSHQRRGWPGITYQFFIDSLGSIYRTNPDLEVVSETDDWAVEGINICFAGDFSEGLPSEEQLYAGGRLCGWLLQEYGLTTDAIVGIGHFFSTESPGTNWTSGANWRAMLLAQVEKAWTSLATDEDERHLEDILLLQAQVQQLQAQEQVLLDQVSALESEIAVLESEPRPPSSWVARPSIKDVIQSLPRDEAGFIKRNHSDISHLVLHHSGVSPSVGVDRIAETHLARGWPGTMYHFFVTADGLLQQTNPLDSIVSDSASWLQTGVNIAVAGTFTDAIPSESQIASTAHLSAWLLRDLGLEIDAIVGASELYGTQSPGQQWLEGRVWKDALLHRTATVLEQGAIGPPEIEELRAAITELEEQLEASQRDVAELTQERDESESRLAVLQAEVERLSAQPSSEDELQRQILALEAQLEQAHEHIRVLEDMLKKSTPAQVVVPMPAVSDIVDDLPRHESLEYEMRELEQITHISVHHSAVSASIDPWAIAEYHISEDPSRDKSAWPGIGYHYYVGPDGTIYQTNLLETVSYHTGSNNGYSVGVCFAGGFMEVIPTPRQLEAGGQLLAWLSQELRIPADNIWGHKEFPNNRTTSCPGALWLEGARWKDLVSAEINAQLLGRRSPQHKSIKHFLLFWYRSPTWWAEADWAASAGYVAAFQPVCGFSDQAAKDAEYVLIVGGTAGVSWQTEENLRRAGCLVERIDGVDEADTRRQLDDLVASNSPFSTLNIAEPWWT